MGEREGAQVLLERLRLEERATLGVDPDAIAYLDAADRIERIRAAYRARLAEDERERDSIDESHTVVQVVTAEFL